MKVRAFLERQAPALDWPAASTIGLLFDREGLTVKRKLRRRSPPSSAPFAHCGAANDVWCIDFKGWFMTGDGARCEPLTLTDGHSRYLLRCQALAKCDAEHVWPVLDAAFREFGLPRRLRSDNGPPFASAGVGGLSRLSVLVVKAGVEPERIAPGKPQQNGRHERMHLTLLNDAATPPAKSLREQLNRLRAFQRVYNEERPHQALGNATPAEHYQTSPRRWDGVLREPDYPVDHEVRRVRSNGEIKWRGKLVYLNCGLAGEPIGLAHGRGRRLARLLRPGRSRRHRPWRRPLAKTQTRRLWTCGQRCALPTGSTASTAATPGLNGTRIVSPMSSVRSVTYVPGCSGVRGSDAARWTLRWRLKNQMCAY